MSQQVPLASAFFGASAEAFARGLSGLVVAAAAGEEADQHGEEYAEREPTGTGGHSLLFTVRGMFECLGPEPSA